MQVLLEIINGVMADEYMPLLFVFIVIVGLLMLFNCILGAITNGVSEGFDIKKFLFGILKTIALGLVIYGSGFAIDMFVLALNHLPKVEIGTDFVTVGEIVVVVVVWCIDLGKEIIEKIKSLKTLKYIKYEDVKIIAKDMEEQ